ncbi:hypothetical protein Tco_0332792 [Tanacetum coccineum]
MDWQLLHKISYGDEIDKMLKISLKEAQTKEEVFFSVAWVRAFNICEPIYPELCREFYVTYDFDKRTTSYEKIQRNDLWLLSMFEDRHQNGYANVAWIARKSRVLTEQIIRSQSTPVYYKDLDRTTLRELIDFEDRLIPDISVDDVQRVAAQRAPRVQRASMLDLYERMGSMEIRQEAIERMEYRKSYH